MAASNLDTYIWTCRHDSNEIPTATPMFLGTRYLTVLLRILSDVTGSQKSKMAASNLDTYISTCRHDSNNILTAITIFLGSNNPIWLLEILCDLTGSWKSKMAAYKLDVPISQLVDKSWITLIPLNFYFRSGRTVFPMYPLDRIFQRPFQRCITSYIIWRLRQKSRGCNHAPSVRNVVKSAGYLEG